ncbi:YjbH domain-containing protein [Dendrosporobacter sp. 1207_IL3150]|uniref:YjbH domain-containing protein n=1 Tax=Dendrosporobacter sp. 1207_IL3150 TaxID=3084054 RepID=UPI002FDA2CB7
MKKVLLATICAAFMATATAAAAPSINGSTGLISTPSADVLHEGQFSLGYYNLKEGGVGTFNTGIAKNFEIGVAGFRYDGDQDQTYLNAKLGLLPETILSPGLAIGIEDVADKTDRTYYAVASKGLPLGFRIHAGVGKGRYDGLFAGIEKTINPISVLTGDSAFPATTLIAEYDGREMNYGARLSIVPGLKVDAGWRDDRTYVGVTFTN